ncbi:MAG: sensor histidine kinase, partial [Rhizobiales bacterium]|nr:sensor histidine kinase [Hyphomicrobiales bacterium]
MSARTASLQRRLLLSISAAIAIAALVALGAIGYSLFHFARGQIDQRLDAQLQAVEAALEIGADGRLRLTRIIDGPPFDRELSGWYWEARPLAGGESVRS